MAIAYWNIVMKESFRFLDIWCTFLKVEKCMRAGKTFTTVA